MLGKTTNARIIKIIFMTGILGLMGISLIIVVIFMANRMHRLQFPNPIGTGKIETVYPSSTHICINGCKPHQNWIVFYLPSNSFSKDSLQLRTSLFPAQILTVGISSSECWHNEIPGYTCLVMELSHRLLQALTGLNVTPLVKLQDTNIWWLEYRPK